MRLKLGERQAKFAREVGSVVLGVLIALGLGAVATEIGWRIEVASARRAMEAELGEVVGQGNERVAVAACLERRLDQLAGIVDAAAAAGRLPPLGDIGSPPYRTWTRGVWDSTISAQTAAHFERDDLDNISGIYEFVTLLNRNSSREVDVWTRLYALVGPGRALDPGEATQLRQAIGEARLIGRYMSAMGARLRQTADAYDIVYDAGTMRYYSRAAGGYPICRPIGTKAPPHYGEAPFKDFLQRVMANPVRRAD